MDADQEVIADALVLLSDCGEYLGRTGIHNDEAWALYSRVVNVLVRVKHQLEATA